MAASENAADCRPAAPRKRDAARTKRRILTAAARHFARSGYNGASLQDIGADAGVTAAMIIHHFGSKMDLFRAVAQEEWGLSADYDAPSLSAEETARILVQYWNDPDARSSSLALARSLDVPEAVELFRTELDRRIGRPWRQALNDTERAARVRLLAGLGMGFGFFSTGALLDPDSGPLSADEAATMERYLTRMIAVLLDD